MGHLTEAAESLANTIRSLEPGQEIVYGGMTLYQYLQGASGTFLKDAWEKIGQPDFSYSVSPDEAEAKGKMENIIPITLTRARSEQ